MADSETVPADSADIREMDRHHIEETCVDQETTPQDVVAALEFDLRDNVGDGPTPRPATGRLVLVTVSRASPRFRNEDGAQERDSTLQSTVAVQGINPTWVDRSSHEEQSSHSLPGNRFAALMDEAEERSAENGEGGPEFLLADVPVSQTETETVGGQSDVEGPVESSWSEPEPIQEADPARMSGAFRDALRGLDQIDVVHFFSVRAVVMKSPPKFVRGAYNVAMRIALQEIEAGFQSQNEERQSKGWKLFLLLPRMLLFRPHRGGLIPKQRLLDRFLLFSRGSWTELLIQSRDHAEAARTGSIRRRRSHVDTQQRRAERAQTLVLMGEVSAGRQALDGASLAPGTTQETLEQVPREEVPRELTQSENTFMLDHNMLTKNLKCARRGAAGGPSGMTAEHLKPLLDNFRDTELFCQVGEHLAQGKIPRDVLEIVRMGRMTALQKANGGVRGIVAGDMVGEGDIPISIRVVNAGRH